MKTLVLFAQADPSVGPAYREKLANLGDFDLVFVNTGGLSESYKQLGLRMRGADGRILPQLVARYAPGKTYDRTILLTFSAGYALAREILKSPADREALAAYVALDSIHSSLDPDGSAGDVLLQPFVDYAKRAKDGKCLFWVGHSDVRTVGYASTTLAARELERLAGGVGGSFHIMAKNVREKDHDEHIAALTDWGDDFVQQALIPFIEGSPVPAVVQVPIWLDRDRSLGNRCVDFMLEEMRLGVKEIPPGSNTSPRIKEYLAPCYRRKTGKLLNLTAGAWCAAACCFAARTCSFGGEVVPHGYFASGIELQEAATANGDWRPMSLVLDAQWLPERGDVLISRRGTGWTRHVSRFIRWLPGNENKFETVAGNEGDRYQVVVRTTDDPDLLGFIEYPNASTVGALQHA